MSENRLKLLVIDDDELAAEAAKLSLPPQWSFTWHSKPTGIPTQKFHAAFVDMHLTGNLHQAEGIGVIQRLAELDPQLEIVAISGDLNRELMEKCLKAGASRFIAKPFSADEIQLTLEKIEAHHKLQFNTRGETPVWIGDSPNSQKVKKTVANLKGENGPILIEGETGTGKEVVARLLHTQEQEGPFIAVNVAAINDSLFDSEFFGHVKGAFTGADQSKIGLAEAANGGDLFLDEIEALSNVGQVKLLRFLESNEVRRVGARESIRVQVRVIAATNQNLEKLVKEGKFREDLLWRLNGKRVILPPLRERLEDIPRLAQYFLDLEKPRRHKKIDASCSGPLSDYPWPGNVRELKRVMEQLSLISPLPFIREEDVRGFLAPITRTTSPVHEDLSLGIEKLLAGHEKRIILQALELKKDVDETARILGISRSSLYKKIKDYQIEAKFGS